MNSKIIIEEIQNQNLSKQKSRESIRGTNRTHSDRSKDAKNIERKSNRESSVPIIKMFSLPSDQLDHMKRRKLLVPAPIQMEEGEIDPVSVFNEAVRKNSYRRKSIDTMISDQKIEFSIIEDPKKSNYAHQKFLIFQRMILGVTAFGFLLNYLRVQASLLAELESAQIHFLIGIYISTFCLGLLLILRYYALFALLIEQKKIYIPQIVIKSNRQTKFRPNFSEFFKRSGYQFTGSLLLELMLILIQPYHFAEGAYIPIFQTFTQKQQYHSVNMLLSAGMILRVYLILRSLINFTMYSSPRCQRLCRTSGFEYSTIYCVKCILAQFSLRAVSFIFVFSVFFLAFGLKVSEGLTKDQYGNLSRPQLSNFVNCIWCIFITMATVGYGDISPRTIPGMLTNVFAAILGVIVSSLMIIVLSSYLYMKPTQFKAHLNLRRLNQQKNLVDNSRKVMAQIVKMNQILKFRPEQNKQQKKQRLAAYFQNLRKRIEQSKVSSRQLKSLIDDYSVVQQMNRLFEILRDGLKQLFANQQKIQKHLQKIEMRRKIQSILVSNSHKNYIRQSLKRQTDNFLSSLTDNNGKRTKERKLLMHKTSLQINSLLGLTKKRQNGYKARTSANKYKN